MIPGLRRVAASALVAGLACAVLLGIGRIGYADHTGWPLAALLFAVLFTAHLTSPAARSSDRGPR